MAFPIAAVAAAAAAIGGAGINAASQSSMNAKTRDHNYEMWLKQNAQDYDNWVKQNQYNENMWAQQKDYNESLWNKQNEYDQAIWRRDKEYDSPIQQMQRFKDAGLNPNLIYGQTNMGGSMQTANLEPADFRGTNGIDSHTIQQWNPKAPVFDLESGIHSYFQTRTLQAQIDNMEAQNRVLTEEAVLKKVQAANMMLNNEKGTFDLGLAKELRDNTIASANAALRGMQVNTDIALRKDEREAALNSSNLQEAAQRIINMRKQNGLMDQQMRLNEKDIDLKEMDINLKKMGIQPGDPMWMRILGQIFGPYSDDFTKGVRGTLMPSNGDGTYKIENTKR